VEESSKNLKDLVNKTEAFNKIMLAYIIEIPNHRPGGTSPKAVETSIKFFTDKLNNCCSNPTLPAALLLIRYSVFSYNVYNRSRQY